MRHRLRTQPQPPGIPPVDVPAWGLGRCIEVKRMPKGHKREPVKTVNGVTYWSCSKCGEVKPKNEFRFHKKRNCPRSLCKSCELEYQKQNYARKREAIGHKVGEKRSSDEARSSLDRASAEWKKRNKERVNKRVRDYRRNFPERARARGAVRRALNSGRLVKSTECEMCGEQKSWLFGHHSSYDLDRRLVVIWLCGKCHRFLHKKIDEQAKARTEASPTPASEPTQTSAFDMLGEDSEDN